MSGLEGLGALGLACNIMQIISFSRETFGFCRDVYNGKSPDAHLADSAAALETIGKELEAYKSPSAARARANRDLVDVAKSCNIAARALQDEVAFIMKEQKQGSLTATLRILAKTKWRKDRLTKYEKVLNECQRIMETRLLTEICKQTSLLEVQQNHMFAKLDASQQHFITQLARGHTYLSDVIQAESRNLIVETSKAETAVKNHVTQTAAQLSKTVVERMVIMEAKRFDGEQLERILNSLSFPSMNGRKNQIRPPLENTFAWALHDATIPSDDADESPVERTSDTASLPKWDSLPEWLRLSNGIYWLSGKAGSGKSTLLHYVLHHNQTTRLLNDWSPGCVVLSHFFWKPGTEMQRNTKGFFCSLLHQALVEPRLKTEALAILEGTPGLTHKSEHDDWNLMELRGLLLQILGLPGHSFCIMIDGMDEISDEDGAEPILAAVSDLAQFAKVKVLASSRPEWRFERHLRNVPHLRVQDLTRQDMDKYVRERLKDVLPNYLDKFGDANHRPIIESLLRDLPTLSTGVFLWVCLAVESVRRGIDHDDTPQRLRERLNNLPRKLFDLYKDMWSRLNEDDHRYKEEGARLLNLVLELKNCGQEASLAMIAVAADENHDSIWKAWKANKYQIDLDLLKKSCRKTEERIKTRCAGLLSVAALGADNNSLENDDNPSLRAVTFIHRSAYDFLTGTVEGLDILQLDTGRNTAELSAKAARGLLIHKRIPIPTEIRLIGLPHAISGRDLLSLRTILTILVRLKTRPKGKKYASELFFAACLSAPNTDDYTRNVFLHEAIETPELDDTTLSFLKSKSDVIASWNPDRMLDVRIHHFLHDARDWTSPAKLIRYIVLMEGEYCELRMRRIWDKALTFESSTLGKVMFAEHFLGLFRRWRSAMVPECLDRFREVTQAFIHPRTNLNECILFTLRVPLSATSDRTLRERVNEGHRLGTLFPQWLHDSNYDKIDGELQESFPKHSRGALTCVVVANLAFLVDVVGASPSEGGAPEVPPLVEVPFAITFPDYSDERLLCTLDGNGQASMDAATLFRSFLEERLHLRDLPSDFLPRSRALMRACRRIGFAPCGGYLPQILRYVATRYKNSGYTIVDGLPYEPLARSGWGSRPYLWELKEKLIAKGL